MASFRTLRCRSGPGGWKGADGGTLVDSVIARTSPEGRLVPERERRLELARAPVPEVIT